MANIFASADKCVGRGEMIQLRPEGECAIELARETSVLLASAGEVGRRLAGAGEPCDLSFAEGFFETADTGQFSGAIDIIDGGLLRVGNAHVAGFDLASQQTRQFEIGNEMEAAPEVVAVHGANRTMHGNADTLQLFIALRANNP